MRTVPELELRNALIRWRAPGLMVLIGLAWLLLISRLMVTDVWDETTTLLLLTIEHVANASVFEQLRMVWAHELPLVPFYRPLPSSLLIVMAWLGDGSFVVLRYVNAVLLLAALCLIALPGAGSRHAAHGLTPRRMLAFFFIGLFSASAIISAGWFANAFDVLCLFFIALAWRLFVQRMFIAAAVAFSLATWCKEAYVLAMPLFGFMLWRLPPEERRQLLAPGVILVITSLLYWSLRHQFVGPLGSEADIHGFAPERYWPSTLSFVAGFLFQFSKFTPGHGLVWFGIASLALAVSGIRDSSARITVVITLLLCSVVYWGLFGYQGSVLVSWENFIGRLYLLPFMIFLYFLCRYAHWRILAVVAGLSLAGMVTTVRDHRAFQQTYLEIYTLAEEAETPLSVHAPNTVQPLEDARRGLTIGHFPDAALRINVKDGGLEPNS